MLTEDDIKEIRENREMIEQGRKEPVILYYKGFWKKDPIIGEEVPGLPRKRNRSSSMEENHVSRKKQSLILLMLLTEKHLLRFI